MTQHPLPASGILRGATHLFPVRVYFEDTDLSGIVYHANYLRFMERARSDLLALIGIDQRAAMEAGEGAYAVADLSLAYKAPARLGDALVIATRPLAIRAASVELEQRVLCGETVLAEAEIRVGFVAPNGRPRRQPPEWRRKFTDHLGPNIQDREDL